MSEKITRLFFLLSLTGCHYLQQGTTPLEGSQSPGPTQSKLEATYASIQKNFIDKKCVSCHKVGSASAARKIPLQTEQDVLNGMTPDDEPLIVPGKSTESIFFRVLSSDPDILGDLEKMPPQKVIDNGSVKPVTAEEIQIIESWINGTAAPVPSLIPGPSSTPIPTETPNPSIIPVPTLSPVPSATPVPTSLPEAATFEAIRATVIEVKCLTCHKPGGKAEDIPFVTKGDVTQGLLVDGDALIIPKEPLKSAFFQAMNADPIIRGKFKQMPTRKAVNQGLVPDVTEADLKLVEKWILDGAP